MFRGRTLVSDFSKVTYITVSQVAFSLQVFWLKFFIYSHLPHVRGAQSILSTITWPPKWHLVQNFIRNCYLRSCRKLQSERHQEGKKKKGKENMFTLYDMCNVATNWTTKGQLKPKNVFPNWQQLIFGQNCRRQLCIRMFIAKKVFQVVALKASYTTFIHFTYILIPPPIKFKIKPNYISIE